MNKQKAFAFIEILLVTAIVLGLCYYLFNAYLKNSAMDAKTKDILSEQGIDTTSYKATINSVRDKVQDITVKRMDELDSIK